MNLLLSGGRFIVLKVQKEYVVVENGRRCEKLAVFDNTHVEPLVFLKDIANDGARFLPMVARVVLAAYQQNPNRTRRRVILGRRRYC